MLAQHAARFLIQRFDIVIDGIARQHAQPFDQSKRKSARKAGQGFIPAHRKQRIELRGHFAVNEMLHPAADFVGHVRPGLFIDKGLDPGAHRLGACNQLAYRKGAPHQTTLFGEIHLRIGRVIKPVRPQMEFRL